MVGRRDETIREKEKKKKRKKCPRWGSYRRISVKLDIPQNWHIHPAVSHLRRNPKDALARAFTQRRFCVMLIQGIYSMENESKKCLGKAIHPRKVLNYINSSGIFIRRRTQRVCFEKVIYWGRFSNYVDSRDIYSTASWKKSIINSFTIHFSITIYFVKMLLTLYSLL